MANMYKRKPNLQVISIDLLQPGKYQPREYFDPEKLQELAVAIKSTGQLLQPLVVRPLSPPHYEIIAGERRFRAAQLAGITEVSCLLYTCTDEEALQAAIIENTSRADLNPIEEAKAYQRLIDEFNYLHEEVGAFIGKSRSAVSNALRLLKLNANLQKLLITGELSEGHGKILASLPPCDQNELALRCIKKNWSVRRLEAETKKIHIQSSAPSLYEDANIKHLEMALSEHLGNKVCLEYEEKGGGYLKVRFNNIDELEGHFDLLGFRASV